jgi:hypothetical protein
VYAEDNWRVNDKLTLNLGLRYEVFTPFSEAHNLGSNFDLATLSIIVDSNANHTEGVKTEYGSFSPRIGFAESLNRSTVLRGGFGISYYPNQLFTFNAPNTFTFVQTIASPSTPAPIPVAVDPTTFASNPQVTTLSSQNLHLKNEYIEQFNLVLQKEFAGNVFSVGYVGELGRQLPTDPDLDRPGPPGANKPQLPYVYQAQLPYVNQIYGQENGGVSNYNALQATYQLRQRHGLTLNANYTYARDLDDVNSFSAPNGLGGGIYGAGLLTNDPGYDYGNSDLDVRHRAAGTLDYQLPFGEGANGFKGTLVKGWEVSSLGFWQTGIPFTVANVNDVVNIPGVSADRPNVTGNPNLSNPSPKMWYRLSAFSAQTPGTLGDSGRNTVYGPRDRRVDLSVLKNIPVGERFRIQFRAECFNVTNTVNWGYPNVDYQTPLAGQVSNTANNENPRQFQFALKALF